MTTSMTTPAIEFPPAISWVNVGAVFSADELAAIRAEIAELLPLAQGTVGSTITRAHVLRTAMMDRIDAMPDFGDVAGQLSDHPLLASSGLGMLDDLLEFLGCGNEGLPLTDDGRQRIAQRYGLDG